MRVLKQSTAVNILVFMTDSSDHITGKTGLTLTITASKAAAAFASITPTVTERTDGWYQLALTTSHTDTLGDFALHITGTGADPADILCQVETQLLSDIPTAVTTAAAVWDRAMSSHLTNGTFGLAFQGRVVDCGTAATGSTSSTLRLATSADAAADFYVGHWAVLVSGTGNGQARLITAYTSGRIATVSPNWTTTPDNTSVYVIVPGAYIQGVNGDTPQTGDAFARLGAPAGASVSADIATMTGYVDTEVAAIKAKTDNLPTDPADASDIAASFSTVNSTLSTIAGYIDTEVAAIKAKTDNLPAAPAAVGDIPTAAANADAVWDELVSDHLIDNTYGLAMRGAAIDCGSLVTAGTTFGRLDSTASSVSSTYVGCWLSIITGSGAGQTRLITAYNGTTKQATISPDWTTAPTGSDKYVVFPGARRNEVVSVTGNIAGSVALVTALDTQAKADVNAEVVDALTTDTYAEPGQGAPAATLSLAGKIGYLFKAWRNKSTQNSTDYKLFADDASTVDQKASTTSDGTTFTRSKITTGP